jgi:uncharacterized protein (DUF885 family)
VRKLLRIGALLLVGCGSPPSPTPPPPTPSAVPVASTAPVVSAPPSYPDDAEIAKATQTYLDLFAEIHPESATSLGLHQHDDDLDDRSIAGHDKATAREQELLDAIEKRFSNAQASAPAKTDLALLEGALRVDIRMRRVGRPLQRKPNDYLHPLDSIFQLTAREYAPAPERAKHALARLDKIPVQLKLAKDNLLNPPKIWTQIAVEEAGDAKSFLDDVRKFLLEAMPDQKAQIEATLKTVRAAFDEYAQVLRTDVMKRSNGRFAAGRELYEYLLANDMFLAENADQLLAIGKKVFADTNEQMTALAKKIDPAAKGWPAVAAKIKSKHPTADDLIASYAKETKRAREFLVQKDAVAFPPGDDLQVIETPSFLRATTSAAYDAPPPFDERSSKGFFFVTPVDKTASKDKQEAMLRENDFADIVDTTVHEAYPGHHLQLSWARLNPSRARRAFDHAILSEGWALYSEELMSELGYYTDAERLIQLEWTLVRAARVIIDVGLHVGDMTYEQAVKLLTDEVHLEKPLAQSEAKRYTEDPTQPSAYIVGREKLLELRGQLQKQKGPAFSLKQFHTDVLSKGTIPPSLIAKELLGDPH